MEHRSLHQGQILRSGALALLAALSFSADAGNEGVNKPQLPNMGAQSAMSQPAAVSALWINKNASSPAAMRQRFGVDVQRVADRAAEGKPMKVVASGPSRADQRFVKDAATSGYFEVAAGKLAIERGQSDEVKAYGQMLIDDHTAANQELMEIAKNLGATVPEAPSEAQQKQLDSLRGVAPQRFDQAFISIAGVKAHRKAINLFDKASTHAKDPALRAFAKAKLPALKKHHAVARKFEDDAAKHAAKAPRDGTKSE